MLEKKEEILKEELNTLRSDCSIKELSIQQKEKIIFRFQKKITKIK